MKKIKIKGLFILILLLLSNNVLGISITSNIPKINFNCSKVLIKYITKKINNNEFNFKTKKMCDEFINEKKHNYFTEEQKNRHRLYIKNGLFQKRTGRLYNTYTRGNSKDFFVVDDKGNFYVHEMYTEESRDRFCHSHVLAGDDVLMAGQIIIKSGRIEYFDNLSGHYKPRIEEVINFMKLILMKNVDLANLKASLSIETSKEEYTCFDFYFNKIDTKKILITEKVLSGKQININA